jgi:hypothetical protein
MSTQITLRAPRKLAWSRGWIAAAFLAATLGLGVTGYEVLRNDGGAPAASVGSAAAELPAFSGSVTGTGPGLVELARLGDRYDGMVGGTGPGLLQVAAAQSDAVPNVHNAAGYKRLPHRPKWPAAGSEPAPEGCLIGQPC